MLFTIMEIIVVGILAWRLGQAAFDKGRSNALFIVLTVVCWLPLRIIGNFAGAAVLGTHLGALLVGWVFGIISYVILAIIVSRLEDHDEMYDNSSWKKRNNLSSEETEKPGGK